MRRDEEDTRGRQTEDTQHDENEGASPLCRQVGIRANGISLPDGLAHFGEAELHACVFGDDPFGIRQRCDGEDVGEKKETTGNHRQFIHDDEVEEEEGKDMDGKSMR